MQNKTCEHKTSTHIYTRNDVRKAHWIGKSGWEARESETKQKKTHIDKTLNSCKHQCGIERERIVFREMLNSSEHDVVGDPFTFHIKLFVHHVCLWVWYAIKMSANKIQVCRTYICLCMHAHMWMVRYVYDVCGMCTKKKRNFIKNTCMHRDMDILHSSCIKCSRASMYFRAVVVVAGGDFFCNKVNLIVPHELPCT